MSDHPEPATCGGPITPAVAQFRQRINLSPRWMVGVKRTF